MLTLNGTYAITGAQGSGKSLLTIRALYDYLLLGRRVVSNLDINLDQLLPFWSKSHYIRITDYPNVHDLWALGNCTDSANESEFGILAIDELAVIANSHDWKNSQSKELRDFLRQARKHGYNSLYLSQDVESIDAQIRKSLVEHVVYCKRTDRINVPLVSSLLKLIGIKLKFPLVHVGIVRHGLNKTDMKVDTWVARGVEYYAAYNTKQKYRTEGHDIYLQIQYRYTHTPIGLIKVDSPYMVQTLCNNMYCGLSAWHLKGRYMTKKDHRRLIIRKFLPSIVLAALLIFLYNFGLTALDYHQRISPPTNQNLTLIQPVRDLTGVFFNGYYHTLITRDSKIIQTAKTLKQNNETLYHHEGKYHALNNSDSVTNTIDSMSSRQPTKPSNNTKPFDFF